MYYLHSCKPPILHLDLKSPNVLLDEYGCAKVCDLGLAHLKMDNAVLTQRIGSPLWTAPEVRMRAGRDRETQVGGGIGRLQHAPTRERYPAAVGTNAVLGIKGSMRP